MKKKMFDGSGGIRTHASEETGALIQRLRPLGHATSLKNWSNNQATHTDLGAFVGVIIPTVSYKNLYSWHVARKQAGTDDSTTDIPSI